MIATVVLLGAIVGSCASLAAADWPEFRGPTRDGISTATNVPVEWSATDNVAWQQAIPGSGWSSPVLVDGKLYLTTATGTAEADDLSLRVICVDASDGHIVWDVEAIRPDAEAAKVMHQKNSLASATPIVAGGRIYAHFGHLGTAALDLAGNVLWRQTDVHYSPQHGNGGSPALVDDLLVFSCDGEADPFIIALDATTGEERWRTARETEADKTFSFCTPIVIEVDGVRQIISPGSGMAGAYDPHSGHELWRVRYGDGFSVVPRPIYTGGKLYLCSGFIRASLLAVDPHGATGDVTDTNVLWKFDRGVPTTPSVLVHGDEVYFVSDNGVATCLDVVSGDVHWTKRLGGGFSASPVFAEGRIYFTNEDGTTYVIQAGKEYELVATNELGERALASPAVDDGTLYLRTASHLWRIGDSIDANR
ncbi:MAG: PQQ-binding-like beta-propeller repeat protein [Pirellulales bacterium]